MPMVSRSGYFYGLLIAGIVFIAIGILSIYYSNTSVKVDIDGIINPDSVDILSPNMDRGGTESSSDYSFNLTADQDGEYFIEINNLGKSNILVDGYAFTKGNNLSLIGQIMLIITGVVIAVLGVRTRQT